MFLGLENGIDEIKILKQEKLIKIKIFSINSIFLAN